MDKNIYCKYFDNCNDCDYESLIKHKLFKKKEIDFLTSNATKIKHELLKDYVRQWMTVISNYKSSIKKLVIIDLMAASGRFFNKDKQISDGTCRNIINLSREFCESNRRENKKIQVNLFFSDIVEQKCVCMRRYNYNSKIEDLNINITTGDYIDVANDIIENNKYDKDTYYLIIYDPYKADINWKILKKFYSEFINVDVIITHFFITDSFRSIPEATRKITIERLERTYGQSIDDLKEICKIKGFNKRMYLRGCFIKKAENLRTRAKVYYLPTLSTKNKTLYDTCVISNSYKAGEILKLSMWKHTNNIINDINIVRNSLFEKYTQSELDNWKAPEKDYDKYYNPDEICKVIFDNFKGNIISTEQLNEYYSYHRYIPAKRSEFKAILKTKFGVKLSKSNINFKGE